MKSFINLLPNKIAMAGKTLAEWIASKESQGYTEDQLRKFLIQKKYKKKDIDEALSAAGNKKQPAVQTDKPQASQSFNFLDKLKYLLSSPSMFFESIKTENAAIAFGIFVVASLLSSILNTLVSWTMPFFGYFGYGYFALLNPSSIFSYWGVWVPPIVSVILSLIMFFIFAGIIHILVVVFKGEGNVKDTYKIYAYSMIPFFIINIIPVIGFLAIIYSLILMIIGISKVHNISTGKAAVACLLPVILLIGIFAILFYSLFFVGFY